MRVPWVWAGPREATWVWDFLQTLALMESERGCEGLSAGDGIWVAATLRCGTFGALYDGCWGVRVGPCLVGL
jgi:hypothetical protein